MGEKLIQAVGQIGVPVKNLENAISFYQHVLALPLLYHDERLAIFECNGVRLLVSLPEKENFAHPSSVIYFQVENINDTYKKMTEKGVLFLDQPHVVAKLGNVETWMVFFKDPDGNTHAFMSEVVY